MIAVFLLVSSPYNKLEAEQEERMRIWSRLVQLGIEQETASYQPAMDMIWQRGDEDEKYRIIARSLPWMWLAAAIIFRKPLRRALHLDQPIESYSVSRLSRG